RTSLLPCPRRSAPGSQRRPHLDVVKKRISSPCLLSTPDALTLSERQESLPPFAGSWISRRKFSRITPKRAATTSALTCLPNLARKPSVVCATGTPRATRPVPQRITPPGFGLSVRPTQQRPGRACRQSRRRRRSRSSRSPPVAAGFPPLPPPGQREVWPVS